MSLVLRGEWHIPKKCKNCLLCESYKTLADGTENEICVVTGKRLVEGEAPSNPKGAGRFCPLVELPEKHGRLIDADAYVSMMEEKCDYEKALDPYVLSVCRGGIKLMSTIVEAESEEDET